MIITNIKGGLGNQMFQYACGRTLSNRAQDKLFLVVSDNLGGIARPFSLRNFNIKAEMMPVEKVPRLPRLFSRLKQKITRDFLVAFDPKILSKRGTVYLDGYFQSEKYFEEISEVLHQELNLTTPLLGKAAEMANNIKGDTSAVSLHVRRGDYVSHKDFGGIVTLEYYERAIAHIETQVPNAKFYVFSDDIAWCQENLPARINATFVSNSELKDFEELTLMSLCQHHIIANSSFSWWGAWLGQNPAKSVIAPKRWSNLHENWYKDIIPSSWIRI